MVEVVAVRVGVGVGPVLARPLFPAEVVKSFFRAEAAMISFRSRQVRSGLALRIRAATPETIGVAADVPPNSS